MKISSPTTTLNQIENAFSKDKNIDYDASGVSIKKGSKGISFFKKRSEATVQRDTKIAERFLLDLKKSSGTDYKGNSNLSNVNVEVLKKKFRLGKRSLTVGLAQKVIKYVKEGDLTFRSAMKMDRKKFGLGKKWEMIKTRIFRPNLLKGKSSPVKAVLVKARIDPSLLNDDEKGIVQRNGGRIRSGKNIFEVFSAIGKFFDAKKFEGQIQAANHITRPQINVEDDEDINDDVVISGGANQETEEVEKEVIKDVEMTQPDLNLEENQTDDELNQTKRIQEQFGDSYNFDSESSFESESESESED